MVEYVQSTFDSTPALYVFQSTCKCGLDLPMLPSDDAAFRSSEPYESLSTFLKLFLHSSTFRPPCGLSLGVAALERVPVREHEVCFTVADYTVELR